jgi:hypothetical protein
MKERAPEEMKAIIDAYIEKKRELGEKPDSSWFDRLFYAGTGLGMLRGNLTPVLAGIKGNADMWHGSPAHNMLPNELGEGILNEGLNLRHAGKNQRLNSLLMSNSAQSMMEELLKKKGRKFSPEDEQYLFEMIKKLNREAGNTADAFINRAAVDTPLAGSMDHSSDAIRLKDLENMTDSKGKFKSLADRVMDRVPELSKRFNIPEEELRGYFEKNIGRLGKRIYFGTSPESVSYWSGHGNEAGYAAKKLMGDAQMATGKNMFGVEQASKGILSEENKKALKMVGSGIANQATGGYYGTLKEKMRYGRPEAVHNLHDLEALKAHLHSMGDELGKHNVMMQYSIPTGTLDSMADFPIARRVIQSSPGLKDMMGHFMPQADPSKDMSISENVSANKIKTVDLVDKATGKLKQRINVQNYEKTPFNFLGGKGNRLNTLKNIAAPAALSLFGASLLHKALAPNRQTKRLADTIPDVDETGKKLDKKAAVNPKVMAALLGIPTVAGLGLAGGTYLSDRLMGRENYQKLPEELESKFTPEEIEKYHNKTVNEATKGMLGTSAAAVAGTALGTFADRSAGSAKAFLGGYLGSQGLAPGIGPAISSAEKDPGALLPFADKVPAVDKFIREHPYISGGTVGGFMAGALPASVYHIAKKYYPYHTKELVDKFKKYFGKKNPLKDIGEILGGKGNTVMSHLSSSVKHLPATLFIPGMGLLGAGTAALATNVIDRAANRANKHISEARRRNSEEEEK